MNTNPENKKSGISRRDYLKVSSLALGGLATVGASVPARGGDNPSADCPPPGTGNCYPAPLNETEQYSYLGSLNPITPWGKDVNGNVTGTPLEANEMRITFMGSVVPMPRRAQAEMSIFVEVGWDANKQQPLDQFVFDLGCGVSANYQACGVGFGENGQNLH